MAVRERAGSWQADFKLAGWARVRETFTTEALALEYEHVCRASHAVGKPRPEVGLINSKASRLETLDDVIEHTYRMRWKAKKAGGSMHLLATAYEAWCGPHVSVRDAFTTGRIDDYAAYRMSLGNANGTLNRHMSSISVLAATAKKLGLIDAVPEFPWQKERQGRIRYYSDDEETALLGTLLHWRMDDWHDLFVFLLDTGARLGEVHASKLKWKDIRGRSVSFIDTKAGTDRGITLTPRAAEVIQRMRLKYGQTGGPFSWFVEPKLRFLWIRLRGHFDWMGADTVVHTFRHTCCSRLVIAGVDIMRVKEWMGHKRVETTLRYAHLAPKHLEVLADVLAQRTAPKPELVAVRA